MQKRNDKAGLTRLENYYLLTNIKGFLIFLLVCYHIVSIQLNSGEFNVETATESVALFGPLIMFGLLAVPLFVMVTGYYSKDVDSCRNNAFSTVLVPYIVLQVVSTVFFAIISGTAITWDLFSPYFQLWYLLSLFIWYMTLKDVVKLKFAFPIMFIASLLVGVVLKYSVFHFDSGMDHYMSLFHTIAFYPYLLIGYYLKPENLSKIRNLHVGWAIGAIVLYIIINIVYFYAYLSSENIPAFSVLLLKGDQDYINYMFAVGADGNTFGVSSYSAVAMLGIVYRLLQYLLVALIGIAMIRLFPKKKIPFLTQLGNASLTVYCLHTFVAIPVGGLLPRSNIAIYAVCVFVLAVAISWILSLNAVHKRYTKFILFLGDAITKK